MYKDEVVTDLIDALNNCPAKVNGNCDWCEFNKDGTCVVHQALKYILWRSDRYNALQEEYDQLKKDYSSATSSIRSERDELDAFILSLDYMTTPFGVTINKHDDGTYTYTRAFRPGSARDILEEIEGL